jgi:tripartite-type tricarboxylate transporter receptor subunit TctC
VIGQKDLPPAIAKTLIEAFTKAAETPAVQQALASINAEPVVHGPAEYRAMLEQESAGFAVVAQRLGMKQ